MSFSPNELDEQVLRDADRAGMGEMLVRSRSSEYCSNWYNFFSYEMAMSRNLGERNGDIHVGSRKLFLWSFLSFLALWHNRVLKPIAHILFHIIFGLQCGKFKLMSYFWQQQFTLLWLFWSTRILLILCYEWVPWYDHFVMKRLPFVRNLSNQFDGCFCSNSLWMGESLAYYSHLSQLTASVQIHKYW